MKTFEVLEGPVEELIFLALSELFSKDLEPHHKSSFNLLSAAMAAACTGLSTAFILLSPPRRLGPDGAPRARFSAAVKVVCRRDDRGNW